MADKAMLSEKFRKAIEESDFTDDLISGLYDSVEGMSDEDFREYLYSNRGYIEKNMPAAVEEIPGFREYISKEPEFGVRKKIDYEKVTGSPDALDRFYDYNMNDMEFFGSQVGMTGKEFLKRMAEDKAKQDRYRIAHGEDEGGWTDSPKSFAKNLGGATLNMLSPRVQEAIESGNDPKFRDYAADAVQNALYATPWGKITPMELKFATYLQKVIDNPKSKMAKKLAAKALDKASAVDAFIETNIPNVLTPLMTESADWLLFNIDPNEKDNPRSEFDPFDVVSGTATNRIAGKRIEPILTKKLGGSAAAQITPYLTNQLGDLLYSDKSLGKAPRVIPFLSNVQKTMDEEREKEKRKEKREKAELKWQTQWLKGLHKDGEK